MGVRLRPPSSSVSAESTVAYLEERKHALNTPMPTEYTFFIPSLDPPQLALPGTKRGRPFHGAAPLKRRGPNSPHVGVEEAKGTGPFVASHVGPFAAARASAAAAAAGPGCCWQQQQQLLLLLQRMGEHQDREGLVLLCS
ncbi:hypothetical protein Esti_001304 [Eimeria stiedai]